MLWPDLAVPKSKEWNLASMLTILGEEPSTDGSR
jgi:hypothetical protein